MSYEAMRDEQVDELTSKHYEILRRKLQGGNRDLAQTIDDAISHELDGPFWQQLVTDAAHPTRDAVIGERFRKLVDEALQAEAEILALKEVEQIEADRENERAAYQFDMSRLFPSFHGAPV